MQDINAVIALGAYLSRCQDAANDLAMWLPAYAAKNEAPGILEVLELAADEISRLKEKGKAGSAFPALELRETLEAAWRTPNLGKLNVLQVSVNTDAGILLEVRDERGETWWTPLDAFGKEAVRVIPRPEKGCDFTC